ncbi:MAG: ATP-dependent ligase LigD phosphoesterase module / ATP-dependent ligase LigD polymerase [Bacteroidota bacterium]|jgi:bifunctional non-homologous end joining protein LigD|nr:ATP-dependent ligase LigD phosphoesterase module / ATP-dependent ligase LigD polymerase [Bacteroidota bacterium]
MGLLAYKKKRNFKNTPEPVSGVSEKSKSKLSFVVQRHKASHLHYDFRLEIDGVLKSWAVPKGPSLYPKDKRLAMMVEDHPYSYRTFTGIIPEGNYGAGIVEIWDNGEFSDIDNSDKSTAEKKLRAGLHAGNLKFRLHGKKLRGEFALVKLKGKQENAWLLIKHKDEFAVTESYDSEKYTPKNSPINKWLQKNGKLTSQVKKNNSKITTERTDRHSQKVNRFVEEKDRKLNEYIEPMLAKETDKPFNDADWIYEMKWDGYRALAEINDGEVQLYSRNGNSFNATYPIIVSQLKKWKGNAVIDGEIVIVDENGKSSFQSLQDYKNNENASLEYRVFDLLQLNGKNLCELPLLERKKYLKKTLPKNPVVKYSDHIEGKGIEFFKMIVENDLEGIMAKEAGSAYHTGARSSSWLKIKNHKSMEAVIAGFTKPTGSRKHFGALILGIWEGEKLKYIGHTGTGFDAKGLGMLKKTLDRIVSKKSPFKSAVKTNTTVTWVKPELVCEVKYTERTRDGLLRHPVFLRLRDDKSSVDVNDASINVVKKPGKRSESANGVKTTTANTKGKEEFLKFGRTNVKVTNLHKVFWPEEGITKGDVIQYYQSISKFILPYLKNRPESLKRNPNGIKDKGFFHKDAGDEAPSWVKSQPIFSDSTGKDVDYLICNNAATLAYMNNLGCIEINPWHSTVQNLDKPDYLVIDIDPSEKNTFEHVIETANVVRDVFKRAGVESFCKTSGATGLHIYVPTQKKYAYDQLKDFAHLVCIMVQEQLPEFTSLERNLKKRGSKMIYLDHLQNRRGQTISSVYSLRPKEGATVSMPLKWNEVKPGLTPADFTIFNALKRMEKTGDLFAPVLGKGIDLTKCLKKLGG